MTESRSCATARSVPGAVWLSSASATGAAHKTAAVKAWLARRPHWHVHFTPTPALRINQVERWFAELTRKQLQRGVDTSTRQLEADIRAFIEQHNKNSKPFKWTKSADDIFTAVKRFCLGVEKYLCHELQIQVTRPNRRDYASSCEYGLKFCSSFESRKNTSSTALVIRTTLIMSILGSCGSVSRYLPRILRISPPRSWVN